MRKPVPPITLTTQASGSGWVYREEKALISI